MERIRQKYICKYQIKKGIGGIKKLINLKKNNFSAALMIDQSIGGNFVNYSTALTTTIPAQLVKKFDIPIVPVYIEREDINFKIIIDKPIKFSTDDTDQYITNKLNEILEK